MKASRIALGLAPTLLWACQTATGPSPRKAEASKAPATGAVASPGTPVLADGPAASSPVGLASQAPKATAERLGIPARVNLPIPLALLGSGASLLGNDGASLLANDGSSLIANDGAALLANDGSSLIANDGAGIVGSGGGNVLASGGGNILASGGGNLRLLPFQALGSALAARPLLQEGSKSDDGLRILFPFTGAGQASKGASTHLLLYAWQAMSLNSVLQEMGKRSWKSGEMKVSEVPMPIFGKARINYLSTPGPAGTGPVIWIYEVGAEANNKLRGREANPLRRALPHMAVHILGEGRGRVLWIPHYELDSERLAFATQFDLAKRQVVAEFAAFRQDDTQQRAIRRIRWAFDQVDGRLRVRSSSLVQGDGAPADAAWRRMALQVQADGGSHFALRQGPVGGPLAWVVDADSGATAASPQRLALNSDGDFAGKVDGQNAADDFATPLGFPNLGLFQEEIPPTPDDGVAQEANFKFPGPVPPQGPVLMDPTWQVR